MRRNPVLNPDTLAGGSRIAPVLTVEDDGDTRALIGAVLDSIDIAYRGFASVEEALEALADQMPALLILDVRLPGLSGLDLCRKVKQRAEGDVAVLLVSAEDTPDDLAAGYAAGADDYLTKPFHPRDLAQRVRRLLAESAPEAVSS